MNQELINQIIKQLETLSLESVRLTQELKALQETTGTITKKKKNNPFKWYSQKYTSPSGQEHSRNFKNVRPSDQQKWAKPTQTPTHPLPQLPPQQEQEQGEDTTEERTPGTEISRMLVEQPPPLHSKDKWRKWTDTFFNVMERHPTRTSSTEPLKNWMGTSELI